MLQGEQPAILDRKLFEAVQAKLSEQASNHTVSRVRSPALLAGRLFDDRGNRMGPSHARKGNTKYRYYLSSALLTGMAERAGSINRVPAIEIEALVIKSIREHLKPIEANDDRELIDKHIARVEVKTGQLIIYLSHPDSSDRDAATQRPLCVAWEKVPATRRREILLPEGNSAGEYSPDTIGKPRNIGRIDRSRTTLARRTQRTMQCPAQKGLPSGRAAAHARST